MIPFLILSAAAVILTNQRLGYTMCLAEYGVRQEGEKQALAFANVLLSFFAIGLSAIGVIAS